LPLTAATLRVPTDYATISDAIEVAVLFDTVLVAPGVYAGAGNTGVDLRGREIVVRSAAGPAQTVIDCAGSGRAFVISQGEQLAVLEGFTIRNGNVGTGLGGGVLVIESSPTIRQCAFESCLAERGGGFAALGTTGHERQVTLEDCTFELCVAIQGGAVWGESCRLDVDRCGFARNSAAYGSGLGGITIELTVEDALFDDNGGGSFGGGIAIYGSTATLGRCEFVHNDAPSDLGSALLLEDSETTVDACVFRENGDPYRVAAAVDVRAASATFASCTFYGNDGPGIRARGGAALTLERCILADGLDGEAIRCQEGSAVTLTCSDVFGNEGGDWTGCLAGQLGQDGNFAADPRFCAPAEGDLTLAANSPCVPGAHPGGTACGLIGALDQGCPPVAVESMTWGSVKARWRSR
jgi:hypothetical protein